MPCTYNFSNLNGDKNDETFYDQEFQKTDQTEFRIEKVIKWKRG